ncbi:MAG: hypothetical protein UR26_C0001G0102 [candidate division TM6 bacterium GW2011_GWF2_32_72]|nr:MAG: hypothetical protein UR26_C0001G0102 [candidate division TM6 bacterium GW2011_GWF2_32_72]
MNKILSIYFSCALLSTTLVASVNSETDDDQIGGQKILACFISGEGHRSNLQIQEIKKEDLPEECVCLDPLFSEGRILVKYFRCDHWIHSDCEYSTQLSCLEKCHICRDERRLINPIKMKVLSKKEFLRLLDTNVLINDKSSSFKNLGLPVVEFSVKEKEKALSQDGSRVELELPQAYEVDGMHYNFGDKRMLKIFYLKTLGILVYVVVIIFIFLKLHENVTPDFVKETIYTDQDLL